MTFLARGCARVLTCGGPKVHGEDTFPRPHFLPIIISGKIPIAEFGLRSPNHLLFLNTFKKHHNNPLEIEKNV